MSFIGNDKILKMYIGNTSLTQAYVGVQQIFVRDAFRPSALHLGGYGIASSTGFYSGYTNYNFRMRAEAGEGDVISPVVRFNSYIVFSNAGYLVAPNAFTIKCSIEYNGINYPVTWEGASTKSLSSSVPVVDSDPVLGVTIPAGAEVFFRTNVTTSSTADKIPTGRSRYPSGNTVEQAIQGGTNDLSGGVGVMTTAAAGAGASYSAYSFGPVAVLSMVSASTASIAFMGDSIPNGFSFDTTADSDGNYGWAARSANAAGKSFINLTRGGNQARWSTLAYAPGQWINCDDATHVVWALGTNDLNTGRTFANLQTNTLDAINHANSKGQAFIAYKLLPRTNTSNVPISSAFDPAGLNYRGLYNDWLDTLLAAGTIQYVRSFNNLCENGSTGTWSNYATQTGDGTHPLPALYDLMVAQESAFYATLSA